jgi:hypothetical protein
MPATSFRIELMIRSSAPFRLAATACLLIAAFLFAGARAATGDDALGLTPGGPGGWGFYPAAKSDAPLPRVLLIGDSIVNGYRGTVIRELKGKAVVDVWLTPAAENDPKLLDALRRVLTRGPYAIVHFNIGLHGWPAGRIPEGQYEPLMKAYVAALREGAPKSTLIWASSTPITVQGKPTEPDPVNNPTITQRNALAAKIMTDNQIAINDLAALMAPNLKLGLGDKFHWSKEGTELQGKAVAAILLKALPAAE